MKFEVFSVTHSKDMTEGLKFKKWVMWPENTYSANCFGQVYSRRPHRISCWRV